MSLLKYFSERNGHGNNEQLFWGRADVDGLPFIGKRAPLLKEIEFEEKVKTRYDAKVRVFDLSKEEDLNAFQEVMDRCAANWYRILDCRDEYDTDTKNWRWLLIWVQTYQHTTEPTTMVDHAQGSNNAPEAGPDPDRPSL